MYVWYVCVGMHVQCMCMIYVQAFMYSMCACEIRLCRHVHTVCMYVCAHTHEWRVCADMGIQCVKERCVCRHACTEYVWGPLLSSWGSRDGTQFSRLTWQAPVYAELSFQPPGYTFWAYSVHPESCLFWQQLTWLGSSFPASFSLRPWSPCFLPSPHFPESYAPVTDSIIVIIATPMSYSMPASQGQQGTVCDIQ